MGTTVLLVLAGTACARWSDGGGRSDGAGSPPESGRAVPYEALPVYRSQPWADELQSELGEVTEALERDEVGGYRLSDYAGRHVEVVEGVRATLPSSCSCPEVELWLTGGSAAFGIGQRDEHTIASELVRLAAADGIRLNVVNLGVPGRALRDEFHAIADRLDRDPKAVPDMIVSFGGFNDAVGALASAAVGRRSEQSNRLENADFDRWRDRGFAAPDDPAAVARLASSRYLDARRELEELAAERGIRTAYFFQPDALAGPNQFDPVADVWAAVPREIAPQLDRQLEAVSRQLSSDVWNLRRFHADDAAPVFVDWAHVGESGALAEAAEVYRRISPSLRDAAGGGGAR